MSVIDRLREWLAGVLGGSSPDEDDEPDGSDAPDDGRSDGLDPTAVSETRTEATDDTVTALREVRKSGPAETEDANGSGSSDSTDVGASDGADSGGSDTSGSDADGGTEGESGPPNRGT